MDRNDSRSGYRIKDRPEYASKPKPLTRGPDAMVADAVAAMSDKNYGSVIVVDGDERVIGVVTERDIMTKIVGQKRDAATTKLSEIMTSDPRLANEDDDIADWLRIMSNERFRRLPVVDSEKRIKAVFTQGDFVSYTWPDLIYQFRNLAGASISRNFAFVTIGGGVALYTIAIIIVLALVT